MLSGNISSGVFLNNDESNMYVSSLFLFVWLPKFVANYSSFRFSTCLNFHSDLSYNNLSLPSSCQEKRYEHEISVDGIQPANPLYIKREILQSLNYDMCHHHINS